jgi:hypothetical protein
MKWVPLPGADSSFYQIVNPKAAMHTRFYDDGAGRFATEYTDFSYLCILPNDSP